MDIEKESKISDVENVDAAKAQFMDTLHQIQSVSRDFGVKTTTSLDLMGKLQFSQDELRTLVRMALDKSLSSSNVAQLLSEKYSVLAEKYSVRKSVDFNLPEQTKTTSDTQDSAPPPLSPAKESFRKKLDSQTFFDISHIPEESRNASYWNDLPFEDLVRCNSFLRFLTFHQIQSLESSMTLERLSSGHVIANEGDSVPFGFIKSGKVEVSQVSEFGREEGRLVLRRGDIFGYEYMDFHDGAEPEADSENTYRVVADAEIYFCSMESLNKILYTEQDDISNWISRGLDLWCRSFCRSTISHEYRYFVMEFLLLWHARVPNIPNFHETIEKMEILYSMISPDLNFRDNLEDLVLKLRPIFACDRCSFYSLDIPNNLMYLFTVDVSKTVDRLNSDSYDNSNQLFGLRMPMKGIAAQVAKTGRPLNLVDCYMSEYFDSAMDIRTGYLSKQMLCVPIINRCGDTIGVMQFINTVDDRAFSVQEEMLASFVATLLTPVLDRIQYRDNSSTFVKPSSMLFTHAQVSSSASVLANSGNSHSSMVGNMNVSVNFHRLLTIVEHRHIKFTCRCVEFGNDITNIRTSIMFSSQPHAEDVKVVELNTPMQFTKLDYGRLTPSSYMLIEFFSKINHPCGWSFLPFYTEERHLQQGKLEVPVFYGNCPPDWMIVGNIYSSACLMGLYDRDDSDASIFLSGMCSGSLLLELIPEQSSMAQSSSSYQVPTQQKPVYYHEYPFAIPPCHFSSYLLHRQMVATTSMAGGELSTWTIPEWLMTLQLPEARRRKFATSLCAHFMILSADTLALSSFSGGGTGSAAARSPNNPHLSTMLDSETQSFLWEHRHVIQQRVPQLFPFFMFTMDWSALEKQQWLLSSLHKWNRLSPAHVLPLLDVRFGGSPLHAFAASSLWSLSSMPLLMLRFFLVTLSQAQFASDHTLHRFLLYRIFGDAFPAMQQHLYAANNLPSPWPLSAPYIWQMLAVNHVHSFVGNKDQLLMHPFLQTIAKDQRAYIAHGLLFFLDVHHIYADFHQQGRFNFTLPGQLPPGADPRILQEAMQAVMHDFKTQLDSLWTGEKLFHLPVGNLLTQAAYAPSIHQLPATPVLSGVQEVRVGSYYSKESMVFVMNAHPSTTDNNNPNTVALPPIGFVYLPHVNYRSENIYNQIIHIMNFIFLDKQVPLSLLETEIFPLSFDKVGNMCKEAVATYVPGVVSLNFLIVDAMKAFQKANQKPNTFQLKKAADPVMTKIPDDLLLAYFAANVNQQQFTSSQQQLKEHMEQVVYNFMRNLAGFLLISHVLSLQGVNTNTSFVDRFGTLFAKTFTSLLGVDASVFAGGTTSGVATGNGTSPIKARSTKRQPLFYLPCFLETIGGVQGPLYREFQQLLMSSFRALREHAALLLWSIRTLFIAHELPLEDMQTAVISVREALMLDVTDDIASQQWQETLQRGLKADYQLKMK